MIEYIKRQLLQKTGMPTIGKQKLFKIWNPYKLPKSNQSDTIFIDYQLTGISSILHIRQAKVLRNRGY
jgi:hypothetical protein